jgi:transposase
MHWHANLFLPLSFTMEATDVYYERLAFYMHQQGHQLLVANKARHYAHRLGNKSKKIR